MANNVRNVRSGRNRKWSSRSAPESRVVYILHLLTEGVFCRADVLHCVEIIKRVSSNTSRLGEHREFNFFKDILPDNAPNSERCYLLSSASYILPDQLTSISNFLLQILLIVSAVEYRCDFYHVFCVLIPVYNVKC